MLSNREYCVPALKTAIERQDLNALRIAIEDAARLDLQTQFGDDYTNGLKMLKVLECVERHRRAVLHMDRKMMTELRSYNNPPETLRLVFSATLLTLGIKEKNTQVIAECKIPRIRH